VAIMVA